VLSFNWFLISSCSIELINEVFPAAELTPTNYSGIVLFCYSTDSEGRCGLFYRVNWKKEPVPLALRFSGIDSRRGLFVSVLCFLMGTIGDEVYPYGGEEYYLMADF